MTFSLQNITLPKNGGYSDLLCVFCKKHAETANHLI